MFVVADGSTTLHTSTGGGILGGGAHEPVAGVSMAFLQVAEAWVEHLQAVAELPLPEPGWVCFNVLTYGGGRYTAMATVAELQRRGNELFDLYAAGNKVITRLRLLEQSQRTG